MKTMVEIEMNNISQSVNALTIAVHNRAIKMAIDKQEERAYQIENLLNNGKDIYLMSLGERNIRLSQKRHELYLKSLEIYNAIGMLHSMKMV